MMLLKPHQNVTFEFSRKHEHKVAIFSGVFSFHRNDMLCEVLLQFLFNVSTYCTVLFTCSQLKQSLTKKSPLPCICVSLKVIFAVLSSLTFLRSSLELSWLVVLEDDVADVTTGLFTGIFLCPDIISLSTEGTKSLCEIPLWPGPLFAER